MRIRFCLIYSLNENRIYLIDNVLNLKDPRIAILPEKKLIGRRQKMSLADNKTKELWRSFMPYRREVKEPISEDLYSVQVYEKILDFKKFDLYTEFTKWAALEVRHLKDIPAEMETLTIPAGLYAVFVHRGDFTAFKETFDYIFFGWLPNSGFEIDGRPHFEILGEKYRNDHPDSEEEVWIPIRAKARA